MRSVLAIFGLLIFAAVFAAGVTAGWGVALLMKLAGAAAELRLVCGTLCCLLTIFALLGCLRRCGVLRTSKESKRRSAPQSIVRAAAWTALAVLGCFAINRALSPFDAVELHTGDAAAAKPPADPWRLRIGAYNIAHGRGTARSNFDGGDRATRDARLKDIAQLLRDARLDVVVLNEVDFDSAWSGHVDQARAIAEAAGFRYWATGRNYDLVVPFFRLRFGNAVLSKYPISRAQRVDYPGYSWWEAIVMGKKQGLLCTIDLPSGRAVRVLAVPLEHRDESVRMASAEVIRRLPAAGGPPLIAAGDFNSTRLGFPRVQTDARGRSAVSLLLADGGFTTLPERVDDPGQLTFSSTEPRSVIDWILVSKPWKLTFVEVVPGTLSDHRAVIGTVEMGQRPSEE